MQLKMLVFTVMFLLVCRTNAQTTYDKFLQCFKNHSNSSDDISNIIYTTNSSSYSSILLARIQNLRFASPQTRKPEFLITPIRRIHVSAAVICTKNAGLRLKIRSGGHDFEGLSYISEVPFVMLDMVNFRHISVDMQDQKAYVEAGATLGELYYAIWQRSNLHGFPAGVCPTVGIGGHISGGGYGNMIRKFGLSVDHIADAELVDVNGTVHNRKSMGDDLFWAIRGGGGASFGVVLSYTLNLVPVPETVTVFRVMRFPEDNVTDLVYKWQHVMQDIDDSLFIRLLLQPVNRPKVKGKVIRVTFLALFLGSADELMAVMGSGFPELGLMRSDCLEMSWGKSILFWSNYDNTTSMEVLLNRTYDADYLKRKSDYVITPIPKNGLDLLWKKITELAKPGLVFNSYGGIMSRIPENQTPFPHRKGNLFKIQYSTGWKDAGEEAASKYVSMVRELHDFMTPYVSKSPRGAYFNYRDIDIGVNHKFTYEESKVFGEKYFRGNFDRLVRVKSEADPDNFFQYEQSIVPLNSSVGMGMAKSAVGRTRVFWTFHAVVAFATWLMTGSE